MPVAKYRLDVDSFIAHNDMLAPSCAVKVSKNTHKTHISAGDSRADHKFNFIFSAFFLLAIVAIGFSEHWKPESEATTGRREENVL